MKLDNVPGRREIFIPKFVSRVLITGENCPRQVPYNDFEAWDPLTDEFYFFIVTGAEVAPHWVMGGSHKFIDMPTSVIDQVMNTLELRKVIIPPFSELFGHGQLTHAVAASHDISRAQMRAPVQGYLISVGAVLRDNVSFNNVSPKNLTNLNLDEENPLPNPPLHIDPEAWKTEHRVVQIPVATTETGCDDMEAVAEDEDMEEEQDDGFLSNTKITRRNRNRRARRANRTLPMTSRWTQIFSTEVHWECSL